MSHTYSNHSHLYSSGRSLAQYNNSQSYSNLTPRQALKSFFRRKVDEAMILHLLKITENIIKVQNPTKSEVVDGFQPLYDFIKALVTGSNVQTPTLMSTTIYLRRLSKILPSNVIGISSTRHRMFVGCLIITSKNLNDSSPLNKHWKNYCLDMLSLSEINTIEREILELFNWNLEFDESELIESLGELLIPQSTHRFNTETPSNSYTSAYSTTSSNSLFSGSQKTMALSSRISNMSNFTDHDYEQFYYKNPKNSNNNGHEFYKQHVTRSDSNLLKGNSNTNNFNHNITPPVNFGNQLDGRNVVRNNHLSNSDSLLNVNRILNYREHENMVSMSNSNFNPNQLPTVKSHRIQHPHFQMDYL